MLLISHKLELLVIQYFLIAMDLTIDGYQKICKVGRLTQKSED